MKMREVVCGALMLLMVPGGGVAQAQAQGRSDWARVEALPPDARVVVGVRGAPRWKCQLVAVDQASLTCRSQTWGWPLGTVSYDRTLAREQIRWVGLGRRSVVAYVTGAAALVGFAVGASADENNAGQRVALGVLLAGGLAFFGYLIGSFVEVSREFFPVRHIYDKP